MRSDEAPTRSKQKSTPPISVVVLFVAVGIALVVGSILLGKEGYKVLEAVALNLGIVALAIVLVDFLWGLAGGSPIDHQIEVLSSEVDRLASSVGIIERAKKVGLENVHQRQADFGTAADWEQLVEDAVQRVDVMGRTSHGWTQSRQMAKLIIDRVTRDNVSFRWLIMSDKNDFLPLLKEADRPIESSLKGKLVEVQEFFEGVRKRLPAEAQSRFRVRVFTSTPSYCAIVRVDDRCLVTHYLTSRSSFDSPFLEFRNSESSWPKAYIEEFESIWESAKEITHTAADL